MEHIKGYDISQDIPTAVTIGNFDGLHKGHRALISLTGLCAREENLKSVVFTFSPHPMFVLKNKEHSALILSTSEKKELIKSLGVDLYIEYPFTEEFASMPPEKFANDIIFDRLCCKVLIIGENYKFGFKQSGNYELLKELGEKRGIKVINSPSVLYDGERISSTRIRRCLIDRDIYSANMMLETPYFISGKVKEGKKLGRTLGFPTINISADPEKLFPPNGVYATKTEHNGKAYFGVTNIGCNPTVNGTEKIVETYLFDFHEVIYGERIKTYVFSWLRKERKFEDVSALKEQLKKDEESSREYFNTPKFRLWSDNY